MKWATYSELQAHTLYLQQQAEQDRLVKEAHAARRQARLAGYFERITSYRHGKDYQA
jgi:hypothetical protein